MESSPTLEKAILLLVEMQGANAFYSKVAIGMLCMVAVMMLVSLLVMEPDFGQTMLILMVWGSLFFIAGMRMIWVFGLAAPPLPVCSALICSSRTSPAASSVS